MEKEEETSKEVFDTIGSKFYGDIIFLISKKKKEFQARYLKLFENRWGE